VLSCAPLRARLTAGVVADAAMLGHLRACAACARYARRLDDVRRHLRGHRLDVTPDPGFAARVAARLPHGPGELLGRAALRLLPATLALALLLAWLSWSVAPDPQSLLFVSPAESPLVWVAEANEAGS
jgi:hypothetical protein